jgi:hypothetical protein
MQEAGPEGRTSVILHRQTTPFELTREQVSACILAIKSAVVSLLDGSQATAICPSVSIQDVAIAANLNPLIVAACIEYNEEVKELFRLVNNIAIDEIEKTLIKTALGYGKDEESELTPAQFRAAKMILDAKAKQVPVSLDDLTRLLGVRVGIGTDADIRRDEAVEYLKNRMSGITKK